MITRPTLISLLGKSKLDAQTGYRTAKYRFSDGTTREVPFFGLGLMDCIKPAKLILAGTSGSMWDVFFDHQKTGDEALLPLIDAVASESVTPDMLAVHEQRLSEKFGIPVQCILISYARDASEQAAVLTRLAEAVQPGENIVLDITHGFRHLPMLALVAARYLTHVRRVSVKDVYYGALEMTQDGQTPVLNLGGMLQMLDWVEALAVYDKSGDYGVFSGLLQADGMQPTRAQMLAQAAYFERSNNPVQARQNLMGAFNPVQAHQGTLGRLFSEPLARNIEWIRHGDRADWELALADRYLARKDYLRGATYLFEGFVSHAVRQQGGNITRFDDREAARKLAQQDLPDAKRLARLRNALAHGVRPSDPEIKRLLQDEQTLAQELRRLRKALFK